MSTTRLQRADDPRRSSLRYPIHADLEYRLLDSDRVVQAGRGRTVNFSSTGILFESESALPAGKKVRLIVQWPARLDNRVALSLHVVGQTVRREFNFTAVQIFNYDFRTRVLRRTGDARDTQTPALTGLAMRAQ